MPLKDDKINTTHHWKHYFLIGLTPLRIALTNCYRLSEESKIRHQLQSPDVYGFDLFMLPLGFVLAFIVNNIFNFHKFQTKQRRNLLIGVDILCIIGELLHVTENRVISLLGGIVIGLTTCMNGIVVPVYVREISPKGSKKKISEIVGIAFFTGEVIGVLLLKNIKSSYWNIIYILSSLLSLLRIFWLFKVETKNKDKKNKQVTKKEEEMGLLEKAQDETIPSKNDTKAQEEIVGDIIEEKGKRITNLRKIVIGSYTQYIKFSLVLTTAIQFIGIDSLDFYGVINFILACTCLAFGFFNLSFFLEDLPILGCSLIEVLYNIIDLIINFSLPLYTAFSSFTSHHSSLLLGVFSLFNLLGFVTFQTHEFPIQKIFHTMNYMTKRNQKKKLNQENPPIQKNIATTNTFTMTPIGYIENSCYPDKFGVPRQPKLVPHSYATLRLVPPFDHPESIRSLEKFSHIWVTFVFHQSPERWTPLIRPPRLGGNTKVGVFASRATHRPNRLGLSLVEVVKIDTEKGICLHLKGHDLINGTPVIDIKPYIPWGDRADGARGGFASEPPEQLKVIFMPEAEKVLNARKDKKILEPLIIEVMAQDPRPAYKSEEAERIFGVYLYDLDVRFRIKEESEGKVVRVIEIVPSHFAKKYD